ncbi:flagellar biosynthesis anti-sigma factor FlgM [Halopseudomonas xiamenensis]|uniref:flagellar biosynthesis anti-sigma factor FlgM n=1 Tax=Halopseudomonas xiamenensis TaxID=157792 RepID=UPI0016282C0C|nr:flagellar biosynthesis anti-sigma factor FlgM [Halopseudomonas xiamenensis]
MVIDFNPGSTSGAARSNQSGATAGKRDVAADHPTAETQATSQPAAADSQVKLSNQAQQLQAIEERLRELPEVDSARVEQIKQAIADGSYKPDSSRIADKLIALEH